MQKHYELGYARRPESMVMWNGGKQELSWEWFSLDNYDDEAQSPDAHDAAVAAVSHTPHLIASALAAATPRQ
ncbi:MAG: prephenate dehydrogenase dimerization domain-containing protein, partial [Bacteroidales bacterium]